MAVAEAVDALLELDRTDLVGVPETQSRLREDFRQTSRRVASGEISEEAAMTELSRRWGYPFARDPDLPANRARTIGGPS